VIFEIILTITTFQISDRFVAGHEPTKEAKKWLLNGLVNC